MVNIEAKAIAALRAAGIDAYADVPPTRPERFATVELSGGAPEKGGWLATAGVDVQAWAPTRYAASELSLACRDAAVAALEADPDVLAVEANVPYLFKSEEGLPRYQFTLDIRIHCR